MVNRHGRWYVAGWDRGRDDTRVFRLGRIAGAVKFCGPPGSVTVPDGADVRELVRDWDSAPARSTPRSCGSGPAPVSACASTPSRSAPTRRAARDGTW